MYAFWALIVTYGTFLFYLIDALLISVVAGTLWLIPAGEVDPSLLGALAKLWGRVAHNWWSLSQPFAMLLVSLGAACAMAVVIESRELRLGRGLLVSGHLPEWQTEIWSRFDPVSSLSALYAARSSLSVLPRAFRPVRRGYMNVEVWNLRKWFGLREHVEYFEGPPSVSVVAAEILFRSSGLHPSQRQRIQVLGLPGSAEIVRRGRMLSLGLFAAGLLVMVSMAWLLFG